MKKILSSLLIVLGTTSMAQPPDFQDLVILYADGKYDKCIDKCLKYKDKDATRKEPMPYFYMSMCFYEISKDQSWVQKNEAYKKAFNDAIKNAAVFSKKDREKAYQKEPEVVAYYEELKGAILEDVDGHLHGEKPKYSKAASELKKLHTFAPDDAGALILKGVCENLNRNRTEARLNLQDGRKLLSTLNFKEDVMHMNADEELSDIEDWEKELEVKHTARLLMYSLIEAAKMYDKGNQKEVAIDYINIGKQWFENVKEYMEVYNSIVNG